MRVTTEGLWKTSRSFKGLCCLLSWTAWKCLERSSCALFIINKHAAHSLLCAISNLCVCSAQRGSTPPAAFSGFQSVNAHEHRRCLSAWLWWLSLIGRLRDIPLHGGPRCSILNSLSHKFWFPVLWTRAAASPLTGDGHLCGAELFPGWPRSSSAPISYGLVDFLCSYWGQKVSLCFPVSASVSPELELCSPLTPTPALHTPFTVKTVCKFESIQIIIKKK